MKPTMISRRYHFESGHFLPFVPEGHRCKRQHGHNYEIEVYVTSDELDEQGFILDFGLLDLVVQPIIATIDHHNLNDIEGLSNPTAELIGAWLLDKINERLNVYGNRVRVPMIRVYETKDCCAVVSIPEFATTAV